MKIKNIIFDVGGTLFEYEPDFLTFYYSTLLKLGFNFSKNHVLKALRLSSDYFYTTATFNPYFEFHVPLWFPIFFNNLGIPPNSINMNNIINAFYKKIQFKIDPQAIYVLKQLKNKGYRLAIISNWDESLKEELDNNNLTELFDVIIISGVVGCEKPSVKLFKICLETLNSQPHECVYIGDTTFMDVIGSKNSGIEPILIDRYNYWLNADCKIIKNLKELLLIF